MSINVHVTGNPISIKRGKMVTSDFNDCKSEFDKRRLMRLEQVRQQSKDIAEGLRNKVKKEKKMQMKEIEKEGKQKLKNWQNRKLLELQNQYEEALQELGVAHRAAQTLREENERLAEQEAVNREKAVERGKIAGNKVCADKIKSEVEKARAEERRKLAKEIEKVRTQLTSPKAKRPKIGGNLEEVDITMDNYGEYSESESEDCCGNEESSECSCFDKGSSVSDEISLNGIPKEKPPDIVPPLNLLSDDSSLNNTPKPKPIHNYAKMTQTMTQEPVDTRISDRIKQRHKKIDLEPTLTHLRCHAKCNCCCKSKKRTEDKQVETCFKENHGTQTSNANSIPCYPSMKLKSVDSFSKQSSDKYKTYDHSNRFVSQRDLPSTSVVEKIPIESIELMSERNSELERLEKERRDKEAYLRGKKALEKERLQKEYEEMLKKLPLLQKKERVSEIHRDKPEFHMSEDRLKEKERSKQNNLENAYNNLFPTVVTIPKVNHKESVLDKEESVQSINVAEWDVDNNSPNKFASDEVQSIIKEFIKQKPRDRRSKLKELLKSLGIQRDELLKTVSSLPKSEALDEFVKDLNSLRKRTISSPESDKSDRREKKTPRKRFKTKSKPTVIILQNTSTQTTPKSKTATKENAVTNDSDKVCSKVHVPCDCNKENQNGELSDDLCHIFIKLDEAEGPEVLVKTNDKEKSTKFKTNMTSTGTQFSPQLTAKHPIPQKKTNKTDSTIEKSRTWKEHLSKNSMSTSSTSYMSPPNEYEEDTTSKFKAPFSSTKTEKSRDPLKPYVNKLLSMSKEVLDNLSVSTSNVETPSQSIIEVETNIPKQNLMRLVDQFRSTVDDMESTLKYSPIQIEKSTEDLVQQYAEVSESVAKRIEALTKMIENLRDEKVRMMHGSKSKSFPENSTSYFDLPEIKSTSTSKNSSKDDEEILRRLIEVDHKLMEELRKQREGEESRSAQPETIAIENDEILKRIQKLKEPETQNYVPFLSDIPKLPKFEPQIDVGANHKRPPPSKGLAIAKKFNGNISLVPHELSTIVEGDSQMSTKVASLETSDVNLNVPLLTIPEVELDSSGKKSFNKPNKKSLELEQSSTGASTTRNEDTDDLLSSLLLSTSTPGAFKKSSIQRHSSSSSSDDLESMEAMLRSIGMEWAIPTLYKTREALALGSSSSSTSLDLSKKNVIDKSTSDISLKDYLKKKVFKVSTSTMISDSSGSFTGDHTELSGIQVPSMEKSKKRTSTPINVSRGSSKSKTFTDSDLSSIRHETSGSKSNKKMNR